MKRSVGSILAAVILMFSTIGGVSAGIDGLGTQGEPSCLGQSTAFVAQNSHNLPLPGVGNLRKWTAQNFPNHPTDVRLVMQGWCDNTGR